MNQPTDRIDERTGFRLRARPALGVVVALLPFLAAASEPQVVRVRAPADLVGKWLAGKELRVMPAAEFEAQAALRAAASASPDPTDRPRLVRARHRARWDGGLLVGKSEMVVEPPSAGLAAYPLEPWTPAILPGPASALLGAGAGGPTALWIEPGSSGQVALDWELRPRSIAGARLLALELPAEPTTELQIEIPAAWSARCRKGVLQGPGKSDREGFALWRVDGEREGIDLRLYLGDSGDPLAASRPWVESTTELDLRPPAGPGAGLANWTTTWSVELDPNNPSTLEALLDPRLELLELAGPAVRGYRASRTPKGTLVQATLGGPTARIRFSASAAVPASGSWPIPTIRPLHAVWTGGTTTVLVDESSRSVSCRLTSGRRIHPSVNDSGRGDRLAFETDSPESAAELSLAAPRAESACLVHGQARLEDAPGRMECRLDYAIHRGLPTDLEIELGPGWTPLEASVLGLDEPVSWHSRPGPLGSTLVRVLAPPGLLARKEFSLVLQARSTEARRLGALDLPRARPLGSRIVDESWSAWTAPDVVIEPIRARGVAWLDSEKTQTRPEGALPARAPRESLAWRYTAGEGSVRVERRRVERAPWATIMTFARIDPGARRMVLEGRIRVVAGSAMIRQIPLWINQPAARLETWRFEDADDPGPLAVQPLAAERALELGFPQGGSALLLTLAIPPRAQKSLAFRADQPWDSVGSIPLLSPAKAFMTQAIVQIETPLGTRTRVESNGLERLDPSALAAKSPAAAPADEQTELELEPSPGAARVIAQALAYHEPGGRLEVATERLTPFEGTGVVRQALLSTSVDDQGRSVNRLRLVANLHDGSTLELKPPADVTIVRVRRDGVPLAMNRAQVGYSLPIGSGGGGRSTVIVIDYEVAASTRLGRAPLAPRLPGLELPCSAFVWEVATPPSFRVVESGPGLPDADLRGRAPLAFGSPGGGLDWGALGGYLGLGTRERQSLAPDLLKGLDLIEPTVADWLTRLDAGPIPVVVDRLALESAGVGPRTRLDPGVVKPDSRDALFTFLDHNGLAAVRLTDSLVITTRDDALESAERPAADRAALQALVWGSDQADRYQNVARWRVEPSPRLGSAAWDERMDQVRRPPGWSITRGVKAGWPDETCVLYLENQPAQALVEWILAGLSLIAAAAALRAHPRARAAVLVIAAVLFVIETTLPPRFASQPAALLVGVLGALVDDLARMLGRGGARKTPLIGKRPTSSLARRAAGGAVAAVAVVLALGRSAPALGQPTPDASRPILALFPYEGVFDPARSSDRVVLTLEDYTRLIAATARPASPPAPAPRARSIEHRVQRAGARACLVETELEIDAPGEAPSAWVFPTESARDITASLDGKPISVSIHAGGKQGSVLIAPGLGRRLVIARTAVTQSRGDGQLLDLPVNPLATARLIVLDEPGEGGSAEILARGGWARQPGSRITSRLGPADRLQVVWGRPAAAAATRPAVAGEGILLWDVGPAGDRLRARFTVRESAGLSTVRFKRDPGLVLKRVAATGATDAFITDNQARGEWTLFVDPPIAAGATVEIDCYRPRDAAAARPDPAAARPDPASPRTPPRLEPIGWERSSLLLGARRPSDWTGRLEPQQGAELVADLVYVQAWNQLPDPPLTFCGACRLAPGGAVALATGPAPAQLQIKPTIAITVEPGRLELAAEAELVELSGRPDGVLARLPAGMRPVLVAGDGVRDWSVDGSDRLRVSFDAPAAGGRRKIRMNGWIATAVDPLKIGPQRRSSPTPWIVWEGVQDVGFLTLASSTPLATSGAGGLTLISSESSPSTTSAPASQRMTYRVDDPARLGEIAWDSAQPRVSVTIESQLAIDPDSAEWTAVLHYDVIGGASGAIHLRLPALWAAAALLHDPGGELQITRETRGASAFWTITPAQPIWGSRRLVLRSTIPLPPERELVHPEIAPLGRGHVDARVSVVNATRRALTTDSSVGLEAIPGEGLFTDPEFSTFGTRVGVFRVAREPWVLRIQSPQESPSLREGGGSAAATYADIAIVVAPDLGRIGRAFYETAPGGRVFSFKLPESAVLLWTSVDSSPATPLRSARELWSIPLDARGPARVGVLWKIPPPRGAARSRRIALGLPEAAGGPVPAVLAVHAPADVVIDPGLQSLERVSMARYDLARVDALARSTREFLPRLDRSSARDHEKLVSMLINQEMILREADRSAILSPKLDGPPAAGQALREAERVELARAEWLQTTAGLGLDADVAAARSYLGLAPDHAPQPRAGAPDTSPPERIPTIGKPTTLTGTIPGLDQPSNTPPPTIEIRSTGLSPGLAGFLRLLPPLCALGAILILASSASPRPLRRRIALLLALALAAWTAGPIALAAAASWSTIAWRGARA